MSTESYHFFKHKAICICTDFSQILMKVCKSKAATFVTSEKRVRCLGVRVKKIDLIFPA